MNPSAFRSQQLEQAITKAKKPPVPYVDQGANAFLKQYIRYQKENYPSLDLTTKEDKNGWWTDYRTDLGYVYITHKIQEGHIDLTFPRASDKTDRARVIADWASRHKVPNTAVVKTKQSVMLSVHVPKLDMLRGFESVDKDELNRCFDIIKELADFANVIEMANAITLRSS